MTGDKNVLEGDIAEQCFDSLWTDLAGYKPSKPDPDRDGIDRETYARVGGEGDERVRLLFQIKGRLIHQQAPPSVTIRVTASNIHNWHGTNDPVYFAVVVGKSKIAVECLAMMVDGDKEGWRIRYWGDSVRQIMVAARRSGDAATQQYAVALINRLGSRGFLEFQDLL